MTRPMSAVRLARGLGVPLALASANPVAIAQAPRLALLVPVAAAAAWWASPVAARSAPPSSDTWRTRLSRHRNTAFPAGCVLLAALQPPPVWLAICVTALLLAYLLFVDAIAAGPAGGRQWRNRSVPTAAYGTTGLVLLAAFAPVGGTRWGPVAAALAAACSAAVVGLALWSRELPPPGASADRSGPSDHRP